MGWKVVATQVGQYNQVLRISDQQFVEVFELLHYADGKVPLQFKDVPKRDEKTKAIIPDEFKQVPVMTKTLDGKGMEQAHRDFAEDLGNKLIKSGPKKGESMRTGWMLRVPDETPIGVYPRGTNFFAGKPQPMIDQTTGLPYVVVPPPGARMEDPRRNHAKILDVLPPEEVDEEAA